MSLCLISMGNSFHVARPWCANECCPYDFVFTLGTMSIRLSEKEHKDLAGVYTWLRLVRYVGLESVIEI